MGATDQDLGAPTDRDPVAEAARPDSPTGIERLVALGAFPGLEAKLALFGRFVGDWTITRCRYLGGDGRWAELTGELHMGWILGGRALQDVWTLRDPSTGALVYEGTTVRLYDPVADVWRSIWISSTAARVRSFVGHAAGADVVLDEVVGPGEPSERWVFTDVRPDAFHWYSEQDRHDGRGWCGNEEMTIQRRRTRL